MTSRVRRTSWRPTSVDEAPRRRPPCPYSKAFDRLGPEGRADDRAARDVDRSTRPGRRVERRAARGWTRERDLGPLSESYTIPSLAHQQVPVAQKANELFGVERIAPAPLLDRRLELGRARSTQQPDDEFCRFPFAVSGSRSEAERATLAGPTAKVGAHLEHRSGLVGATTSAALRGTDQPSMTVRSAGSAQWTSSNTMTAVPGRSDRLADTPPRRELLLPTP